MEGYSRRDFIRSNSLYGSGGGNTITHIGSYTLSQLRNKYRSELFDHFLPNMDQLIVDHQYGGFMCDIDIDLRKQLSSTKKAWFEGRGIWVYSYLYNNFGKVPDFLNIAGKSKDFILKHLPSDDDFWISSFTREGAPVSGQGDIFGNLYIAEGLAEYAKASGNKEYFWLAKKILLNSLKKYDSPDYIYAAEKTIKGPRVLNHWMIMLWNSTQMLENEKDLEIEALAERCVDAIMNHHLNPEFDLLNVTLHHNLERPVESDFMTSFGLGIQALWMVFFEALRTKDAVLFNKASQLFKRHVNVASDQVFGGYFWSLDQLRTFSFKLGKSLSIHDEVLIGLLFLLEHTGDEWANELFKKTYAYIQDKFIRPEYAFAVESGDRKLKNYSKKGMGIYHHPRQLMMNLSAIDRLIARKGEVTNVFS